MMRVRALSLPIVLGLIVGGNAQDSAWAWGQEGHVAVARIADKSLSTKARNEIDKLLGTNSKIYLPKICMFADNYKHQWYGVDTKPWHYVDIPVTEPGPGPEYKASRDCENDDCVVAQIKAQQDILRNPSSKKKGKVRALKFLVHFVGDIHQPLHCGERAKDGGGNSVWVELPNHSVERLHIIWDGTLLGWKMGTMTAVGYADELFAQITPTEKTTWESEMDPVRWANDGHFTAWKHAYDGIPLPGHDNKTFPVTKGYVSDAQREIDTQIKQAGVRLAALLNETFK